MAFTVASLLALNFQVLLPLVVTRVIGGSMYTYGLLMSDLGLDMIVGSLWVAGASAPTLFRIAVLALVFGLANFVAGLAHNVVMVFGAIGVLGIAASAFISTCSGYLMSHPSDNMGAVLWPSIHLDFWGRRQSHRLDCPSGLPRALRSLRRPWAVG